MYKMLHLGYIKASYIYSKTDISKQYINQSHCKKQTAVLWSLNDYAFTDNSFTLEVML